MNFLIQYIRYLRPHGLRIAGSVMASLVYVAFAGISYWLAADFVQALFRGGVTIPPLPEGPVGPHNIIEFLKHHSALLVASDNPQATLRRAIVIIVATFLVKNLALYVQTLLSASVEQQVARSMRDDLYSRLLDQDLAFFHMRKSGDLVSAGVNDVNVLNSGLADSFGKLIRDPITAILFLILLLAISWKMTLAALLIAPLSAVIINFAGISLKRKSQRTQQRLAHVTARLNDALYGIHVVHAYGGQESEREAFSAATSDHFRQALRRERLRRLISPMNEVVGVIVIAGILLIAGTRILSGGWLDPDDFVRFLVLLFGMLNPIVSLGGVQGNLKVAEGAAIRVFDLMDAEHFIREKQVDPVEAKGFSEIIRFNDVELKYSGDREPAVTGINLEIRPGERIVLVGRSGGGKSTLLNLLPRFFDPSSGKICLDGVELKDYRISSLRRLFGVVSQEVMLFNDSIRANIAYDTPEASDKSIVEAAKQARAHDFIVSLPDGYDTNIGDLGDRLSGGQRQRISIARALLKDPPFLLLDEPTSALDADVAEELMRTLDEVSEGRTVITATHRLASISAAERILLLEQGRLIGGGTHSELYRKSDLYRELFDRQFA